MFTTVYSSLPTFTLVYHFLHVFIYMFSMLIRACLPLLSRVYLCLLSFILFLPMFKPVWSSLPMFTRVSLSSQLHARVYLCLPLINSACSPMFTHVYSRLPIFKLVYLFLTLLLVLTYVYHCLLLFMFSGVCLRLPPFILVHLHLSLLIHACLPKCTLLHSFTHVHPFLLVFTYIYSCLPKLTMFTRVCSPIFA